LEVRVLPGAPVFKDHYHYALGFDACGAPLALGERPQDKQFFFEKKNQKTSASIGFALPQRVLQVAKSRCFLFQRESLSCFVSVSAKADWYETMLSRVTGRVTR
jgi:hypothetical protein